MPASADEEKAPRQPSRSVSLLSPEQLERKRRLDRESQRQTRSRLQGTLNQLKTEVQTLTEQLRIAKLENLTLQSKSELCDSWSSVTSQSQNENDDFLEGSRLSSEVSFVNKPEPREHVNIGIGSYLYSDPFILQSQISTERRAGANLLDPSLISHAGFPFDSLIPAPLCVQVWEARPVHLPSTCRLDKIFLDIIKARRAFNPIGGNLLEFSNTRFPNIAALLNPQHHSSTLPLTTAIVTHVIYVLTVATLPEQIAIMYVMCSMMRWQITGSRKDYDAMPEWLRPGAAQLVTGHPAWVDVFPWPGAREAICQNFEYHNNWEYFKTLSNQTISINWPYDPSDALIAISDTEYSINPVFMTHIRTLSNWTLGQAFVDAFPDLAKHIKVGRPRGQVDI